MARHHAKSGAAVGANRDGCFLYSEIYTQLDDVMLLLFFFGLVHNFGLRLSAFAGDCRISKVAGLREGWECDLLHGGNRQAVDVAVFRMIIHLVSLAQNSIPRALQNGLNPKGAY
jgi:hypothetical protein